MKALKLAALLFGLAIEANAGPYQGLYLSTTTGIAMENLSGYIRMAANQSSSNTNTIVLDGISGSVRASSAALTGADTSGISVNAAGQVKAASFSGFISTQNFTNGFNAASQLVQLNGSGNLPALNASLLTNLSAPSLFNAVPSGLVDFSTITTALAGKQASGNYITALTGDGTAAGPGSVALTLAGTQANILTLSGLNLISHAWLSSSSETITGLDASSDGLWVKGGVKLNFIDGAVISTANITAMNGASNLVQLNASSQLPAVSGALLTGTASSLTAGLATAVAGGAANQVHYQTGAGVTGFISAPGANMVLWGNSGAPSWTNTPTFAGTNLTGTAASLTAGNVTTNANLTGDMTSVGNATTAAATQANITTLSGLTTISHAYSNTQVVTSSATPVVVISSKTASANYDFDFASVSQQAFIPTGNITVAFKNKTAGAFGCMEIIQDGTGTRTFTWPTVCWTGGSTRCAGAAPTLSTGKGVHDQVCFYIEGDGVNVEGFSDLGH